MSWLILGRFAWWQKHTIPLYLASVSLFWCLLSTIPTDAMTPQHRSTVLWGLAAAAITTFVGYGLMYHDAGDALLFAACVFALLLPVLTLAAKWIRSALPFYVLLALGGMLSWWLRKRYGIAGKSGISTALVALLTFSWAGFVTQRRIWQDGPAAERFFGKPFLLSRPNFLALPFAHVSWIAAPLAFGKAVLSFQSLALSPLHAVTVVLYGVWAIGTTYRFRSPALSLLALLCAVTLMTFLCLALPPTWLPLAILAFLSALGGVTAVLRKRPAPVPELFATPLSDVHRLLVWVALPASFAGYSLAIFTPLWAYSLYSLGSAVLLHYGLVKRHAAACHAVILHGMVLWGALFFYAELFPWALPDTWSAGVYGVAGLSLLLFAIAYTLETATAPLPRRYATACHAWLAVMATLVTLYASAATLLAQGPGSVDFLLCYAIVHAAARRFPSRLWAIPKSAYALTWGLLSFDHPALSPLAALFALTALEVLLRFLDDNQHWRLFTVVGYADTSRQAMDLALPLLVSATLLLHLYAYFAGRLPGPFYPYALYLLVPFGWYIRQCFPSPWSAFPALGLFAYSNGFLALHLLATVRPYGINAIHALAAACIVSIACQTAAAHFLRHREQTS